MKKRQINKILKRSGPKLYKKLKLTSLEKRVCDSVADSKFCSALCKFHNDEFEADTIYGEGYIDRLKKVYEATLTIENITGVKGVVTNDSSKPRNSV